MNRFAGPTLLGLSTCLLLSCTPVTEPASPRTAASSPARDPLLVALLADASRARDIACDLSDRVGPRLAGSAGDARAVAWGLEEMKALGLGNVRSEPVTVKRWERGAASATLLADGVEQTLAVTALGGSIATPGTIEAEVLSVESLDALKAMAPDAANGKIVFFRKRMIRSRESFSSYGETVPIRSLGAVEAARHGAVASVIRSVGTSDTRFPHTGAMHYDDTVPKIPAAAIAVPDAEMLERLLARGPVRLRLSLEAKDGGEAISANMIGEVKGRTKPEEIVLLGAHLDSWDLGRGAVDDGAGVGVVLDVARVLAARPPARTVRVVLFANEENGLAGAREYARAHAAELERHQLACEVDSGAGLPFGLQWRAGASAKDLFASLDADLAPLGIAPARFDEHGGGADTIPLRAQGVPTFELLQDGSRYFDLHHSADDTCDKIVPAEIAEVRDAILIATWRIAETPALIERAKREPAAGH